MSLFVRIFLFFWLTAALLASTFFVLGRLSGSQAIDQRREALAAQAVTVATLWQQGGPRLTHQWLNRLPPAERLWLLDHNGQSPFPMHGRRHRRPDLDPGPALELPLTEGVQRLGFGQIRLVVAVPDIEPPLFLVARLDPGQLHRLPRWLWLLSAVIIISLLSYLLARALSRRILQLRRAVQGFSNGDLQHRVELGGDDEVSALARDFNRMADHINDMLASQRRLVSDVSHELRSPLARLRIALELAQRPDNRSDALARIEKEADELEALVTQVLTLARIESGQFQLERRRIALAELLANIVRDANFESQARGCTVELHNDQDIDLFIDPVLIRAAVENVIRNAIRHSPAQGRIEVFIRRVETGCQIIIEDQGPGVPPEALEQLFKPFARVPEARDRASGGFGLGLAISGRNLQAHGGHVRAENRDQGGLRVILSLPIEGGR